VTGRSPFVVLVVGTATEVGKTWVTARLAERLVADGATVAASKPVQSYEPGTGPTDAEVLAAATGQPVDDVCPPHRCYEVAMAPPMAADVLGRPRIALADLVAELAWPADAEVVLVETVGGVRSPISHDGDAVDLARALDPDLVLLVSDAALGTINAVRLAAGALSDRPVLVVLNRFDAGDDLHVRNRAWLVERDGFGVVTDVDATADAVRTRRRARLEE
jgi:dethiobiotin synthetase